jgi:hypothetical protein
MKKQTSNLKELTTIYLALRHFFPLIKKSRYNINRKSGAMNVAEDMEIIKNKLLAIKSSTHSGENKCNDRQIEQTGDKRRLSPEKRSISNDSIEMEILSESRPVHIKIKQASKDLCISNSKK